MKKVLAAVACIYFLSACSLFKKSEKLGCKGNGRNMGAEKLVTDNPKALKESSKAKYRGGRKSFQE